jgi:glycosyltransferase involved in cell wall biosynthesis
VPYTYFPDPSGGTEVFVRLLAQRLQARGFPSAIAAPGARAAAYRDHGLPVYRFAVDSAPSLARAYGAPDETAATGFASLVADIRPRIVHLHARTSAVSERLIDIANAAGAKVVFTYHTPTASCARGTMMLFGRQPCDGAIDMRRCIACALAAHNVSAPIAHLAAAAPAALTQALAGWPAEAKPLSHLRIPGLLAADADRLRRFMGKVDHVVAVCQWVREVLSRNGVPDAKITVSRQGIDETLVPAACAGSDGSGPLRIAYFGRIDRAKGPDLLARALALAPKADVSIDIYGVRQPGSEGDAAWLDAQARLDGRLGIRAPVAAHEVVGVMARYDLVAVPSRWLETGPLVVLEAFAARVPVLGASHGGIAEIVRDGIDGMLVAPDDSAQWAAALDRLAADRSLVRRLRAGIAPPRAMNAAADDMAALYARLAPSHPASSPAVDLPHQAEQ